MKSISASIIVAAGAAVFLGGIFTSTNNDGVAIFAGCALGLAGLIGWIWTLSHSDKA